ncbi:MAG: DUF1028 domain-containing protein [Gammaproteobacteria bacterium]|nr:DUF1028 domain-containing protein [Gammaproteobacteria bacterium]
MIGSGRMYGMVFVLALVLGGCATTPPTDETTDWLVEKVVEVEGVDAARIRNQSGPFLARLSAQAAAENMTIAYQYRGITLVTVHPDGRYILGRGGDPAVPVPGREPAAAGRRAPWDTVATFSIVGYDPETEEVGVAVQSRVFSVGNGVIWGEAGVGVVATQAVVDVSYGPQALALLREGYSPAEVVERVLAADPNPDPERWSIEGRQFSVMNAQGEVATHTGPRASDWAGHRVGRYTSAQGNILAGQAVVDDMVAAFEDTPGHLSQRLVAALEAGQAAGGDTRGMQSAALLIVKEDGGVWLNNDVVLRLHVDDHAEPIAELRRLVEMAAERRARRRR